MALDAGKRDKRGVAGGRRWRGGFRDMRAAMGAKAGSGDDGVGAAGTEHVQTSKKQAPQEYYAAGRRAVPRKGCLGACDGAGILFGAEGWGWRILSTGIG